MYDIFRAVQEDLYDLKNSDELDPKLEVRLFVMHYLLRDADHKDIQQMLKFVYGNYKTLAEHMKKNYNKEEDKHNEIFSVSGWADSIN